MSSGGNSVGGGGGGGGPPQQYFCYQCNRTVSITPSPTSDLTCPNCNDGFLEEYENPNPSPNPSFSFSTSASSDAPPSFPSVGFPFFDFQTPNNADLTSALFGGGLVGGRPGGPGGGEPFQNPMDADAFNPFLFLQNYLQNLRDSGANIQFVIENNAGGDAGGAFRIPANLGDYFIGPGLEQLIQQLAENDPNRYGTPPASKEAIGKLPDVKINDEMLVSDSSQCAVCKDKFELDSVAKLMPCKHIYHPDCIIPWLELHNSCPVCRYELPTDDPDYEQRAHVGNNNQRVPPSLNVSDAASVGGGASQESPQTRRFRVPLPWPFRAFGSGAEASNSGNGNNTNSGNSGGESNTGGGRANPNFGSETRQEDLD